MRRAYFLAVLACYGCAERVVRPSIVEQYERYRATEAMKQVIDDSVGEGRRVAVELALEFNPNDVGIQTRWGRFLMDAGMLAEAKEVFERILRADHPSPEAYLNLVTLAVQSGESPTALDLCVQGLNRFRLDPRFRLCREVLADRAVAREEGMKRGILQRMGLEVLSGKCPALPSQAPMPLSF